MVGESNLPDVGARAVLLGVGATQRDTKVLINLIDDLIRKNEEAARKAEARAKSRAEERAAAAVIKAQKELARQAEVTAKAQQAAADKAAAAVKRATAEIEAAHKKQQAAFNATMKQMTSGVGKGLSFIWDEATKAIKTATIAVIAFGVAIGAALIGAGSIVAKFQEQMARVGAVSLANDAAMARLNRTAIEMSRVFTFDATAVGNAQEEILRAGVSIEDTNGIVLRHTLALATLTKGEMELGKVANFVGGTMKAWGIEAESVNRITDTLAAVSNASAVSTNDLMRSMQQVSAIGELAGAKYEDLVVLLGLLGQEQIRNSDAGTSLKQMYISLMKATGPAAEAMEKFHIGLLNANGSKRTAIDIIMDLKTNLGQEAVALGKVTEAERLNALAVIFGSDAMRAGAIMAQLDTASWEQMSEALTKTGNSATEMATRINATLLPQLSILKNNLVALILEGLGPLTDAFGKSITDLNQDLQRIDLDKIATLGRYIAAVATDGAGDIASLRTAFGELATPIQQVVQTAKTAWDGMVRLGKAVAELGISLFNLATGSDDFSTSLGNIEKAVKSAADWIAQLPIVLSAIVESLPAIGELAAATFDWIVEVILNSMGTSSEAIAEFANEAVSVFNFILGVAEIFTGNFEKGFNRLWASQGVNWANAWNNLTEIVVTAINDIIRAYNTLISSINPAIAIMLFGTLPQKIEAHLELTGSATNKYVSSQAKAFDKLKDKYDATVSAIEKRTAEGAKKTEAALARVKLSFASLLKEPGERPLPPKATTGTSPGKGGVAAPPFSNDSGAGGAGGAGDDIDALTDKIMKLMAGFPAMNRNVAEFMAQIAKATPARLMPMVNALWQSEGIAQKLVITARNYAATQIQIAKSEQKLTMLRAQQAVISAKIGAIQAEATLRALPLRQELLQIDGQINKLRSAISIIDERINKLTRENLTLKLEAAQIEGALLAQRQRIADIDYNINLAQRRNVEAIAERLKLENSTLPVRQKIAQLERQAEQVENKRLKLLGEEKRLRLDIQRVGIEKQLRSVEKQLDKAWEKMDVKSILSLETQKTGLEDQLDPIQQHLADLQSEQELVDLNNQLAINGINQQIDAQEQLILAEQNRIFVLQQLEQATEAASAAAVAALELEKQLLLDSMEPSLRRLFIIQQTQAAEQTRVAAAVVMLQMEKQALEDQIGPLERRRAEINLQIQAIELETAAITAQMAKEEAHLALAIAQEEATRAELELTRLKQEEVFTELIKEFADSISASGAFSFEEALETAKRLGFWNDQIQKLAELVSEFARLEEEAIAVQDAIGAIERNVDIVITTTYKTVGSAPSYQHGGTVPGPYGKATMVMAHGGERFLGMAHSPMMSTERMLNNTDNSRSITNDNRINVEASYANQQSPASIRMDLAAIRAAARR